MADNNAGVTRNLDMQITALPLSWHLTAMLQLFTTLTCKYKTFWKKRVIFVFFSIPRVCNEKEVFWRIYCRLSWYLTVTLLVHDLYI